VRSNTFDASKVNEVVDEDESEITFGQGKGLLVDSWLLDAAGEPVPTTRLFIPKSPVTEGR